MQEKTLIERIEALEKEVQEIKELVRLERFIDIIQYGKPVNVQQPIQDENSLTELVQQCKAVLHSDEYQDLRQAVDQQTKI